MKEVMQVVEVPPITTDRKRSWYLLVLMSLAFGMGELSHFLVGTTTRLMAQDLHYGDQSCMKGPNASARIAANVTCSSYSNATACLWEDSGCVWDYNGQGIAYQILAGPSFILAFCVGGIVMGVLSVRYNRIVIYAVSIVIFSSCTIAMGAAQDMWTLVALRFGVAIGESASHPVSASLVASLFPMSLTGAAMGVVNWGIYFGYGLSYIVGTYIPPLDIGGLGWRWAYYLTGIPGFFLAFLMLVTTSDPRRKRPLPDRSSLSQNSQDPLDGATTKTTKEEVSDVPLHLSIWQSLGCFRNPSLLLLCLGACIRHVGGCSWAYNAQLYHDTYYPDFDVGMYLFLTSIVGGSIGILVGGVASDRIVKRVGVQARAWILATSQLVAAPCAAGVLLLPPPYNFICLLAAYVFAEMWMGILFAVMVEIVPKNLCSLVVGIFLFVMNNVGGNLPVVIDPISKSIGYRETLCLFYPGGYLMSGVVFAITGLFLRRRYP